MEAKANVITQVSPTGTTVFFLAPHIRSVGSFERISPHERSRLIYTYPDPDRSLLEQLNEHLENPGDKYPDSQKRYSHPRYGDLGTTTDQRVQAIKEVVIKYLPSDTPLEVLATMSLAVLATLVPNYLSRYHDFPETYDIKADIHWAKDVYGKPQNTTDGAFAQLVALAKQHLSQLPEKPKNSRPTKVYQAVDSEEVEYYANILRRLRRASLKSQSLQEVT